MFRFLLLFTILSLCLLSCNSEDQCDINNFIDTWSGQLECNTNDDFVSIDITSLNDTMINVNYDGITIESDVNSCNFDGVYTEAERTITIIGEYQDTVLDITINDIKFIEKSCSGQLTRG